MSQSRTISWIPYGIVIGTFFALFFGFDFNGLYGQDAHEYYRHSRALKDFFDSGTDLPMFHWPHAFSALGALIGYTGIPILLALQLISLIAVLVTIASTRKIIQLFYNSDGTWLLVLGAATQVYFIRSGYLVMSDALCCMLLVLSLFHLVKLSRYHTHISFVLTVLFAIAAVFVRYASLPISFSFILFGVLYWTSIWKSSVRIFVLLGAAITVVVVVLMNNILFDRITAIGAEWSISNFFTMERSNGVRMDVNTVPNFLYIFSNFGHLGYLSFGVFLLPWLKKWNWKERYLWMSIGCYLLFLGGLATQNQRFLLLVHPLVLLLVFPGFQSLLVWLHQRRLKYIFLCGAVLLNGAFFYYSFSKLYGMHAMEKELVTSLEPLKDDKIIYSFYVDLAFGSYDLPNPTENLWDEDITFVRGNYAVFNPVIFSDGWEETPVWKNWRRLKAEHELKEVKELPENWKLYRIE
ncbi:MAG: hypothetical protein NXI10_02575 [bacterium]|nr:hypothetical protein [bacterium]